MKIPPLPSPDTVRSSRVKNQLFENREHSLKKAVTEFESLFIYQMLKIMREAIPSSGFLGNSREEKIYQSMLDQEVARNMASKGGIGLTEILLKQLTQRKALPKS